MPQIAQIAATYSSQIFWLLIVFGLIYFGIGKGMLPKIEATVEARDQKIESDLAAAQAARATADETEASYRARMEEARNTALKAKADAKAAATIASEKKVKAVDKTLSEKMAAADASLKAAQAKALGEIESVAAEAAQEIVAKVSGLTVDKASAEGAVKAALAAA